MEKKASSNKYYETILDWFKSQIMSGELKEGDTIPSERELATRFGVSRVPVREALRILEYIGIVSNTADGMTVQKVDIQLLNPKANFATDITMEPLKICSKCGFSWSPRLPTTRPSAGRTMTSG